MADVDPRIVNRYIQGLIKHRTRQRNMIFAGKRLGDDQTTLIMKSFRELVDEKSVLTPEVIFDRCQQIAMKKNEEWWQENSAAIEATVYFANDDQCDVEEKEISELYTIIQRNAINTVARTELMRIAENINDDGAIDNAIDIFRRLKAVMPTAVSDMSSQSVEAVREAIEGAKGLVPYGIQTMDTYLGGSCRGEITIIAGRPSHGKTSFICQLVVNWLQQGLRVLFISKEMAAFRIHHKMFSNIGGISADNIKRGTIENPEELKDLADRLTASFGNRFFLYDDVYSDNRIETLIVKHRPDIVIDDFIQLSEMNSDNTRTEITRIMKRYKQMSKEYQLSFIVTSQLNRSIESREDPVPRLSDLAESGALEQLAADILFIFYPYKMTYNPADRNRVEIIAAKTRYGDSCRFELGFDGNHMRYFPVPKFVQET